MSSPLRNDVVIEQSGDAVVVRDPGAQISAGESCSSIDSHAVSCVKPGGVPTYCLSVEVRVGDGDDFVTDGLDDGRF